MPQSLNEIRAAYNLAAKAYADLFIIELREKPLDVEWLRQFASSIGHGQPVLDLGCGPGHTTAHLASLGLRPTGVDLSEGMIATAKSLFPHVDFRVGDFFNLPDRDNSVAGLLAFYCIVHLQPDQLLPAFREMFRVLEGGGVLLLSFHIGTEAVRKDNFLETGATLEFFPFPVAKIQAALVAAGFSELEIHQRPPYETEYPTDRCYIFSYKRQSEISA